MGNRGTTRSWDEEEIEKYGLFGFWRSIARSNSYREDRERLNRELITLLKRFIQDKQRALSV